VGIDAGFDPPPTYSQIGKLTQSKENVMTDLNSKEIEKAKGFVIDFLRGVNPEAIKSASKEDIEELIESEIGVKKFKSIMNGLDILEKKWK
jgi:translation initiation factor IF-2